MKERARWRASLPDAKAERLAVDVLHVVAEDALEQPCGRNGRVYTRLSEVSASTSRRGERGHVRLTGELPLEHCASRKVGEDVHVAQTPPFSSDRAPLLRPLKRSVLCLGTACLARQGRGPLLHHLGTHREPSMRLLLAAFTCRSKQWPLP